MHCDMVEGQVERRSGDDGVRNIHLARRKRMVRASLTIQATYNFQTLAAALD